MYLRRHATTIVEAQVSRTGKINFMSSSARTVVLAGATLLMMLPAKYDTRVEARAGGQAAGVAAEAFDSWLAGVRKEAVARGIREETVTAAFDGLQPLPVVLERDRSQAELVLSLDEYLKRRLTTRFVRTGREMSAKHRTLLRQVTAEYGVDPKYLVAIWGIESNYGRFQGVRPTIQALATLAWDGRRGEFFKGELFNALQIIDLGYIPLSELQGSWAGAMGQTQFMPSSYLKHAQDFDHDGDRDIWHSEGDIFASMANYLKAYGWMPNQAWGREVKLPRAGALPVIEKVGLRTTGCRANREMTNAVPLARWSELGVRALNGGPLPKVDRNASLVHSDRRSFLVYSNYEALLGYNCAHTYALSVALLADRIGS